MTKRTLQGTNRKKIKTSGFRNRMHTTSGRRILQLKRKKKRKTISLK